MALSTSNSESGIVPEEERSRELPHSLRLTAADRPGVAQPVPVRDIPVRPWRAMAAIALLTAVLLTAGWEWRMRMLDLVPGDLGDDLNHWADQRRQVDYETVPIALLGDSRMLLNTDLNRFARLTGTRPLQLSIIGTSALPTLEDLAADPKFKGLVLLGMNDVLYFSPIYKRAKRAIGLSHWRSPANQGSYLISRQLTRALAMLDADYELSTLVFRLDPDVRKNAESPRNDVWKIEESWPDGQAWLWRRYDHDPNYAQHTVVTWRTIVPYDRGLDAAPVRSTIERSAKAIAAIRARGGDVAFIHAPSSAELHGLEENYIPRAKGWNVLLATTHTKGAHADDIVGAQTLDMPEGAHLSRTCATVWTDMYIRALAGHTPLLRLKPNAPPALSADDCSHG